MNKAFHAGWAVVKGHYPMGEIKTPKKDKCGSCGKSTWHRDLGIEDEEQADGQMVPVGGGPPMWLCDDCAEEWHYLNFGNKSNDRVFRTGWAVVKESERCERCGEMVGKNEIAHTPQFGRICYDCYDVLDEDGEIKTIYGTGNYA